MICYILFDFIKLKSKSPLVQDGYLHVVNVFIIIGIAQAFFLSGLLLVKKNRQVFDNILLAWLLINSVQLYFFYVNFSQEIPTPSPLLMIGGIWPYLAAPILYFYVLSLVKKEPFRIVKYSYHFIPFIVYSVYFLYYYYSNGSDQIVLVKNGFIQMKGTFPFHIRWYAMIMAFFNFLYPTMSLFLLVRHRSKIENEFSYLEKINLNWLKYWIILSIFGFWISFGIIHAANFRLVEYIFSFHVVASSIVVNIFVIGFYGLRQTTIFTDISHGVIQQKPDSKKFKSSTFKDDSADKLVELLNDTMINQKPYLNNQLTIDDLAQALSMKRHQLSQLINEVKEMNFYNYINGYRVNEFKMLVNDPKYDHLSLLGIAMEAGFNSKSSFNHIFKKNRRNHTFAV